MADSGANRGPPDPLHRLAKSTKNNGFRQAMLKAALHTTPQLTDENYSVWKDKMSGLLELRGVLDALKSPNTALTNNENAELKLLLISKMDTVTHNNFINADNRNSAKEIWKSVKERFASSQSSNRARIFNDFLYLTFKEDAVDSFITEFRVSIKKMIDVGIDLPQDILAYLVLFKFPASLQLLKRQIMHSDKDLKVEFVCNHLTQFNNEAKAKTRDKGPSEAALPVKTRDQATIKKVLDAQRVLTIPSKTPITRVMLAGIYIRKRRRTGGVKIRKKGKSNKDKNQVNYYMSLVMLWINPGDPKSRIILNSGASAHIFNDKQYFSRLELNDLDVIKTGKENATLAIKGIGEFTLRWKNRILKLQNCLFVPDIVINLISPGCLDKKGCSVSEKNGCFKVSKSSQLVLQGSVKGGLYSVDEPTAVGSAESIHFTTAPQTLQEIHESFGHASIGIIDPFIPKLITSEEKLLFECKSCVLEKITKKPFKGISTTASKPLL
ncbi:hypothetical protein VP01_2804g1 [Puccinia sorghi]|uniref:Retrovirus-related Pol polyprotein from transposon TNT 1-94-like beta-barrel domain-containing protein n=1 Tax=Puccinia sorghi TaxID=27349 RepID=A0A0L6V382_9BASI|nr:hypothetical protein VP01_2804g1 [Puccinia sorghi]